MKRQILTLLASFAALSLSAQEVVTQVDTLKHSMDETLEGVTVVSEKNKVVYKLDLQRVSGSASLAAQGGTAVDILRSLPSVRIDAEGGVTFRGSSGFIVYVDGKKSPLEGAQALQQIAASSIEDIEIITTPSARYRTDGDAGIINIITKRHSQDGISGSVSLAGSTIGAWNKDILLTYKKAANSWYLGLASSQDKGKSDFQQHKWTKVDDYETTSESNGIRTRTNSSYIARLGWDYNNNGHHLILEGQTGITETARGGDLEYKEQRMKGTTVINDNVYMSYDRYSNEKKLGQLSADYIWKINDRGDELSARARARYDWYALEYTESNMFTMDNKRYEGTRGYESEHHWDIDADLGYILNYRPTGKAEFGYQFTSYSEHGEYNIKYWDRAKEDFEWQDDLHAPFYYRRQLHSLYAMFTDRFGPVAVDAGLRADNCIDWMDISIPGASRFIRRYELYPSAHLSYEAPGRNVISAGYSYRTNRPGIWQLEPYITYEDYYTKKIGNPDIRPEYIHSAEVTYRKTFSADNSLAVTGFYRHRDGVREYIRVAYEPGVTLDSLINAGVDQTAGLELSAKVKPLKWWSINLNGSAFHYKFKSTYEGCTDDQNFSYSAAMINNFNAGKTTKIQFDANFVGPRILTQGRENAYYYFDLAVRQQIIKNQLYLSLVGHDVFRTAKYYNYRKTQTLNSTTLVRPRYPNIMLSLSYTFNGARQKEHSGSVSKGAAFEGKDF
jgi:outer membrane receptor protein involved in Fe transport